MRAPRLRRLEHAESVHRAFAVQLGNESGCLSKEEDRVVVEVRQEHPLIHRSIVADPEIDGIHQRRHRTALAGSVHIKRRDVRLVKEQEAILNRHDAATRAEGGWDCCQSIAVVVVDKLECLNIGKRCERVAGRGGREVTTRC